MKPAVLLLVVLLPVLAWADGQQVYVSCLDDRQIRVYTIQGDGKLEAHSTLELRGKPGPMALSRDRARVYVATTHPIKKQRIYRIVTLQRLADGGLRVEGSVEVDTRPTYLRASPSGKHLLTASYGAGHASVYALAKGLCSTRVDRKATKRTAHCVEFDASGRFAFVPHTAPNAVYQFRFDAERGTLTPNAPPAVDGPDAEHRYHGPRHIRFHPSLPMAYTSNEFGGGISSWRLDSETGTLTREQTLSTIPPGFEGRSTGAEVRITPDGRFAYVSNRDHGTENKDTLAGFAIDATGALRSIGQFPTASIPRAFTIDTRGAFVYAAGQKDGRLACYRVDPKSGELVELERLKVGKRPSWVLCVDTD